MSQENVEIARRGFEALARSGVDAAAELWHPEISWRAVEGAPDDVGEMHGIEAARRYVEDWFDTFEDFRSVPEELLDVGDDRVIAVIHVSGRARISGVPTELRYASVSTIRDGKVIRVREYATKEEALKAVGLEE
ncbi:MAG TPA: nuclear transport factor 2 family protein [Solirubrobacteraceae bacterium]